ncbi:14477_t:CDS:2, partial [Entrophospora sp. SA101]
MFNQSTHHRQHVNRDFFHDYTWLKCTTDLSLEGIKRHLKTSEHEV